MATATIKIAIEAQTAMLQKGFAEAKGAINSLEGSMAKNVAGGMAMFTAGLAAVQGVLATVQVAISNVMAAMDQMGAMEEMASRLGTNADALTVLGYAAEQTGASQDVLNGSLEKMSNLIGEASAGTDSAVQAFAQLGLSVSDLQGLSADQAFAKIAEQMQQVGSSTEMTKIAIDIFGRSGGQLVNMLSGGAEGLNAFGVEAEQMGLLLGDARGNVEAVGDSINKMKRAWGALWQQLTILVAPALGAIAELLAEIVGGFNRLFGAATGGTGPAMTYASEAKRAEILIDKSMKNTAKSADDSAKAIKNSFRDIPKPADWKSTGIAAVTKGTAAGFSAVQEANRARQDDERRHRDMISWLAKIHQAQQENAIRVEAVTI